MKKLLALVLVLTFLSSFNPASAADERKALVFGDSISAWYNDTPGSASQGWWSIVSRHYGITPVVAAEAGSGYWSLGNKCQGTNFNGRLNRVTSDIDLVIVAGGFNDTHGCLNGKKVPIKRASTEKAINNYMGRLATKVDSVGIPRDQVYVFTPWGTEKKDAHYWSWRAQKATAAKYGFTYRTVRFMDRDQTRDGIHPNLAGSQAMAHNFIRLGGIQ